MIEIICVDSTFSKSTLDWYNKVGVEIPIKNTIYTIRHTEKTFNGLGLFLEELVNPIVPVKGVTGIIYKEVSFSYKRFTDLQGNLLVISEVLENIKSCRLDIGLELVSIEDDENNN
jgi:hypothetical protein